MSDDADALDLADLGPALPPQPYPGLRPFTQNEWVIFFGRESMTQDVVSRLLEKQFVAVHGDSGCGKSSLIAAGVMPFLEHDQARAGGRWTTAIMRPQDNPLGNLARALAGPAGETDPSRVLDIRRMLNRGADAPAAVARHLSCNAENNVCILFDQFEELFEHARRGGTDAALITNFLVGLSTDKPKGLHAILTMRSDYLGHCAHYRGFAETVNETQYLVPRMERPALLRAIREPAALYGGWVDPDLAARMIADAGMGQDQLPLMQHGLMLMWRRKARPDTPAFLDMEAYSAGSLASQLSRHADEVMAEAIKAPEEERVVELLFRALTDRNPEGLAIRRRQTVAQLVEVTGAPRETLVRILDRFRADDVSFLRPFGSAPLTDEDEIDISHEAFIRNWRKISEPGTGWLDLEANDGLIWTSLRIAADAFEQNPEARLSHAAAVERERWLKQRNATWAERYGGEWESVSSLIKHSGEAARASARRRRSIFYGAIAAAAVFAVVAVFAVWQTLQARDLARLAKESAAEAAQYAKTAREQQQIAEAAALRAEQQTKEAEARAAEARENLTLSVAALSRVALNDGLPAEAVKLALAAWPRTGDATRTPRRAAIDSLANAFPSFFERLRLEHPTSVSAARFSPDGTVVATASKDGIVRLWDAKSGAQLMQLVAAGELNALAFSPDGKQVAATSTDQIARVWDVATGNLLASLVGHEKPVTAIAFSPDGTQIATGSEDSTARIWNATDGHEIRVLKGHSNAVWAVAYSPDGTRIATGSNDNTARVWDANSGAELQKLEGHVDYVWAIAYSPDGTRIVTGSKDRTARIWDTANGTMLMTLTGHSDAVTGVEYTRDGNRIATSSWDATARLWDATRGYMVLTVRGHYYSQFSISLSPDGERIVTASSDSTSRIFEVRFDPPRYVIAKHTDSVWGVAFSPDGSRLMSASNDMSVRAWDALTGLDDATFSGHTDLVWNVAYAPDGKHIVSASRDKTARVWDVATQKIAVSLIGHGDAVSKAVYSADGKRIATSSWDRTARLWDADTGQQVRVFSGHEAGLISVAISRDGTRLATGSDDGSSRVWDTADGSEIMKLDEKSNSVWAIDFSPDGSRILTASGNRVRVWDSRTGGWLLDVPGHSDVIYSAVYSPDGSRIATASKDGTARLWDAATGTELAVLEGTGGAMTSVAFSPNGTHLAAAAQDGAVRVWDISLIETGDAFHVACQRLGNNVDLAYVEQRYALPPLSPICGENQSVPIDLATVK